MLLNLKQGSPLWKKARKWLRLQGRVSGTGSGSILGLNPYESRMRHWRLMKGLEEENQFENQAMRFGKTYEPMAIERALGLLGVKEWGQPGILVSDGVAQCSPDAMWEEEVIMVDQYTEESHKEIVLRGLEVKCPHTRSIPEKENYKRDRHYILQAFHCLMVARAMDWHLYYFNPRDRRDHRLLRIWPDQKIWMSLLNQYEHFFSSLEPSRKRKHDQDWALRLFDQIKVELVI